MNPAIVFPSFRSVSQTLSFGLTEPNFSDPVSTIVKKRLKVSFHNVFGALEGFVVHEKRQDSRKISL